jgi:hypothetical protein
MVSRVRQMSLGHIFLLHDPLDVDRLQIDSYKPCMVESQTIDRAPARTSFPAS